MLKKQHFIYLLAAMLCISCALQAMVFDNRHLPLFYKPWLRWPGRLGHFRVQPFLMRADRAHGDEDEGIGLPDIDGQYDQVAIGNALLASRRIEEDPFRSDFRGLTSIPWRREGRIDAEGIAVFYEQFLGCLPYVQCDLSIGGSWLFAHVSSLHEFFFETSCFPTLSIGDREYLFLLKERMNKLLDVGPPLFSRTVIGDGEFYLRFSRTWDYTYKFRHIDAGFKFGVLAPFSPKASINNPAAISVGGNKHWGVYAGYEGDFELKEDWHAGVLLRDIKRLPRTDLIRLPIGDEPNQYGAIVGNFRVNPGWTLVAAPQVTFEALRDGFGLSAIYTVVGHLQDRISDCRVSPAVPANIALAERRSSWASEYVTLWAFYDFGKYRDCRGLLPTVSLTWDMPTHWLVSKRSNRTHSVSLMVEFDF